MDRHVILRLTPKYRKELRKKKEESRIIARALVGSARATMKQDWHKNSFRRLLQSHMKDLFPGEEGSIDVLATKFMGLFAQPGDDIRDDVEPVASEMDTLNGWVDELMRFLAMKSLYMMEDDDDQSTTTAASKDNSRKSRRSSKKKLVPSNIVKVGWKCLLQLPLTYLDVCLALGNDKAIEFDADDEIDINPNDEGEMVEYEYLFDKNYRRTVDKYKELYGEEPPKLFWPSEVVLWEKDPLEEVLSGVIELGTEILKEIDGAIDTAARVPDKQNDSGNNVGGRSGSSGMYSTHNPTASSSFVLPPNANMSARKRVQLV